MADWVTISSLATAGGTLVLAVATFASVRSANRSANRSARIAEVALQEQRRPLLAGSRFEDPEQKIMFVDQHWVHVTGGHAVVEHMDGMIYLVMSLRNVGAGIGVCQGWGVCAGLTRTNLDHFPEAEFRTWIAQGRADPALGKKPGICPSFFPRRHGSGRKRALTPARTARACAAISRTISPAGRACTSSWACPAHRLNASASP